MWENFFSSFAYIRIKLGSQIARVFNFNLGLIGIAIPIGLVAGYLNVTLSNDVFNCIKHLTFGAWLFSFLLVASIIIIKVGIEETFKSTFSNVYIFLMSMTAATLVAIWVNYDNELTKNTTFDAQLNEILLDLTGSFVALLINVTVCLSALSNKKL